MPAVAEDKAGPHDPLLWNCSPSLCGSTDYQSAAAAIQQSAPHAGAHCAGQSPSEVLVHAWYKHLSSVILHQARSDALPVIRTCQGTLQCCHL